MLTALLKQTPEYKRLLAGMAGAKPAVVALFGMPPTARAQMLAALCEDTGRSALVVCAGEADATRFAEDAAVFGRRAEVFPARDYVLRPVEGQSHEYEYRRLAVLGNLVGGRTSVACAPVEAVLQYTTPKQEFCGNTLTVKQGMAISMDVLIERLFGAGYLRRFQVDGPGQFSVRGGIVDIYAPDMQKPHRLEFWGDEVDSIHSFDLVSQRREGAVKKIYLSPAREVLFGDTEAAARLLRTALSKAKPAYAEALADAMDGDLKALDAGTMPAAMDKYLALRYEKPATIFEYFDAPIVFLNEPSAVREAAKGVEFRFGEAFKGLLEEGVLAPGLDRFYEDTAYLLHETEKRHAVVCENFARTIPDLKLADTVNAQTHSLPPWGGEVSALADDLRPLTAQKYAVAVLAGTQRAAAALARDLAAAGFSAQAYHKEPPSLAPGSVGVFEGHLNAGADYPFAKFAVFTSRRHNAAAPQKARAKSKGLSSLSDITPGDYVVHQNHGIGVYAGIQRLDLQGVVKDYIKINYDKADTLYVPVTQLDLISRYTAPGDGERVKLSKLGGDAWNKTKSRVRKATQEMAKELIALYARRQQAQGYAFPEDNEWQRDFETRFEYDETADQLTSAAEIKKDMEKPHPMDRLLCGDVGVGKTEVALRAAFKCIMGGKQVAVLVPTTILAWQHYTTILSRMEAFPVKAGLLSRFASARQQKETIKGLAAGTVDVVVGTHRMLQKDVKFHDLGLVIIDEEQRFGVGHKEQMKNLRESIDVLTLSATPIPRTMQMSLSGVRDMSLILTPPDDRLPVKVHVGEWDPDVVSAAIRFELARGGQVYYVSNRVRSIEEAVGRVQAAAGEARVGVAHGQMSKEQLERVMEDFSAGELDVLVATTIIESGIDNPHTNTLIIEDSQRYGLAQMYQLKGRVGRSCTQAYAYFMFPEHMELTEEAAARLTALNEHTDLGSGMRIAMRDLEIRGAGSLLGTEQSGNMSAVGFDLFAQMLNQAVSATREGDLKAMDALPPALSDITVNVPGHTYLPEEYVPDADERVLWYRRIASAATEQAVEDVRADLADKRPDMPQAAKNLLEKARIKAYANEHHIKTVSVTAGKLVVEPVDVPRDKMTGLRRAGGRYLADKRKLSLPLRYFKLDEGDNLLAPVAEFLEELAK